MHGVGSRNKLTPSHARLYPGSSMLDVLGRAVCTVGCLPRKELHEAWEMATRVREHFRGGRVVDLCCGFGLLAQVMLLLDESSPDAIAVDVRPSPNHAKVHAAIVGAYPALAGRVRFVKAPLSDVALSADDVIVSAHACGSLTDDVLGRARSVGARVAVLPCCHAFRYRSDLAGDPDPALAIDRERVRVLSASGYAAALTEIPVAVSPKNRLLLAEPNVLLAVA